eukprot:scaffold49376_cov32-Tisochrysis_lutea.AAC.5
MGAPVLDAYTQDSNTAICRAREGKRAAKHHSIHLGAMGWLYTRPCCRTAHLIPSRQVPQPATLLAS